MAPTARLAARTARLTAWLAVRRPAAPAGQPNQTKNNVTPTIVRIAFLMEKRNSHNIQIYGILCKREKSNSRSNENRNQRKLLSFLPDKDREEYAILVCDGEK